MQNLFEAFDYNSLFGDVMKRARNVDQETVEHCEHVIAANLKWAKEHLKNRDRITWWCRYIKAQLLDLCEHKAQYNKEGDKLDIEKQTYRPGQDYIARFDGSAAYSVGDYSYKSFGLPSHPSRRLEHLMSLDSGNIQSYVFGTKPYAQVFRDLERIEAQWIDGGGQRRIPTSHPNNQNAVVLIEYGKMAWYDLQRPFCSEEGKAMRHCGNSPRSNTEDTIISLRSHVAKEGKTYFEPHLTFTMDEDHYLQERKARGNSKPPAQYHPMIVDLLLLKNEEGGWFIEGLGDGHWQQEDDFKISDLSAELKDRLLRQRPEMGDAFEYAEFVEQIDWELFRQKLRYSFYMNIIPQGPDSFSLAIQLPKPFNFIICKDGCAPAVERAALTSDIISEMPFELTMKYRESMKRRAEGLRKSGLKMLAPFIEQFKTAFEVEFQEHGHTGKQNSAYLKVLGSYAALEHSLKSQDGIYWSLTKLHDKEWRKQVEAKASDILDKEIEHFHAKALVQVLGVTKDQFASAIDPSRLRDRADL